MDTSTNGKIAEHKVITKLMELGFCVSVPVCESQPYDLIADKNGRMLKIQVKKAYKSSSNNSFIISVSTSKTNRKHYKYSTYDKSDFDYLIGVVFETNDFYIVPMSYVQTKKKSVTINPLNEKRQRVLEAESYKNKWIFK